MFNSLYKNSMTQDTSPPAQRTGSVWLALRRPSPTNQRNRRPRSPRRHARLCPPHGAGRSADIGPLGPRTRGPYSVLRGPLRGRHAVRRLRPRSTDANGRRSHSDAGNNSCRHNPGLPRRLNRPDRSPPVRITRSFESTFVVAIRITKSSVFETVSRPPLTTLNRNVARLAIR
jgi:hypothetical protein